MEIEFKDLARRRRFLLTAVGLTLALGAGFGAYSIASKGTPSVEVAKQSVLVATREIAARTPITVDDVAVRQLPMDDVLTQSYRAPEEVVGRLTAVPVYAGQQMAPNLFATSSANAEFSILGPEEVVTADSPYWRAVAVQVPASRAVGGEIEAGQHVDLFVSVQIDVLAVDPDGNYQRVDTATEDGLQSGTSTKITFQDLEVLKADPAEGMYVLKVDLHQAEEIYHIVQVAPDSFSLALRPEEDTRAANTLEYGETTDRLVMTYLFPVPQLLDLSQLLGGSAPPGQVSPTPGVTPNPASSPAPGQTPVPSAGPNATAAPTPGL